MLKIFHLGENEAGTDEAGRGCLAGPVTAAAVILPEKFQNQYSKRFQTAFGTKKATIKTNY